MQKLKGYFDLFKEEEMRSLAITQNGNTIIIPVHQITEVQYMDIQHFGSLDPDPPKNSRIHGFGFNQPKPNFLLSKHKSKLLTNQRVMKSKFQPKKVKKN